MSGTSAGSTEPLARESAHANHYPWKRKLLWLLMAFMAGFLLAWFLHKCPQLGAGGGDAGGGGGGGGGAGAPGAGAPTQVGQGGGAGGGGGRGGEGTPSYAGAGSSGTGSGNGDAKSGDSPAGKAYDGSDPPPQKGSGGDVAGDLLKRSLDGKFPSGGAPADSAPSEPPPGSFLSAHDFTYDSTGLPRYSSAVTGVASGLRTDITHHQRTSTTAIVTGDSFDKTVDWYKSQVPAGWHASTVDDVEGMAKALSPSAIQNMLSGATGSPVDTASITAAQDGHKTSVAIFSPPNQTTDRRSIMIVTKPGAPTQIIMYKKSKM